MNTNQLIGLGHDDIRQAIVGRFTQPATKELSPGALRIVELYAKALMQPDRPLSPGAQRIVKKVKALR